MNQMWQIEILIEVGEYQHDEYLLYFGTEDEARRYADAYLSTIWGEGDETVPDVDITGDVYYSDDMERAARLGSIRLYDQVVAMTDRGTLPYKVTFTLA